MLFFIGMVGSATLTGDQPEKQRLGYLASYRYRKTGNRNGREFREYEVLIKSLAKVYLDFASMRSRHFYLDNLDYMGFLMARTGLLRMVFLLADRLVRNMAYDPGLYEIDIKTGKAIDHGMFFKNE